MRGFFQSIATSSYLFIVITPSNTNIVSLDTSLSYGSLILKLHHITSDHKLFSDFHISTFHTSISIANSSSSPIHGYKFVLESSIISLCDVLYTCLSYKFVSPHKVLKLLSNLFLFIIPQNL